MNSETDLDTMSTCAIVDPNQGTRVHLVDPRTDVGYAATALDGSLFSSPRWIRAVSSAYDFEPRASVLVDSVGAPVSALPWVEIHDLRGGRIIGFPFSDFCAPPGATQERWPLLLEPLMDLDLPISLRLFADRPLPCTATFKQTGIALWHATDVSDPEDDRWSALSGSARRNIRKARANGVEIERRNDFDAFEIFHDMHRHVRRAKYRMLAQGPSFFRAIADEFLHDNTVTILLATLDREPIGGVVLLEWQDTLYYKFNASTSLAARPNDLLAWHAMNLAAEKGLRWFDFGLSDPDQEGLVRYKKKFATTEAQIVTIRHEPAGYEPAVPDQAARSLDSLTQLLSDERVPNDIIDAASELLYRNFA